MITLRDVAAHAGVSVATASNALSGTRAVSPASVKAVMQAAADLGYRRNETARSLRTGLRNSLGLVVPDVTDPFWGAIVRVVEARASELGWSVSLCNTDYDADREGAYLARLVNSVDGILLLSASPDPEALAPIVALGVPVVACDERVALDGIGGVYSENRGGGRLVAEHLVAQGGTRFVAVGGPPRLVTARERVDGFVDGLIEYGVDPAAISRISAEYSFDGGRDAARRILADLPDADAVFACTDNQAMGVLFAMEDAGRHVPDDVMLSGFDGISWSARVRPSLTTVQQDSVGMADRAFDMLAGMIAGDSEPSVVTLPVALIPRKSTRRSAAGRG